MASKKKEKLLREVTAPKHYAHVWVCERKAVGSRTWRPEATQSHPPPRRIQKKSWEGVDGARYRMRKYYPQLGSES